MAVVKNCPDTAATKEEAAVVEMTSAGYYKTVDEPLHEPPTPNRRKKRKCNFFLTLCTVIATVSSTLLGYDIGVMSGALLFVSDDLKLGITQQELVVGSLQLVSVLGGLAAGRLSDAIGRRKTMALAAGIFLVGAVVMALSPSFAVLFVGRIVTGVAVGFALMIAPVYSAELSPARLRGSIVSLTEVFINFGILLGYIVSFALQDLPTHINWRLMLGAGGIPAIVLGAGVLIMPESPRWLVTQRRMKEARYILLKANNDDEAETQARLADIMEAVGFVNADPSREPTQAEYDEAFGNARRQGSGVWRELLIRPTPAVRRMLVCMFGIHVAQQACGIDSAVYYSPVVFGEAGVRTKLGRLGATVGVGFTKFIFIFVATTFLDNAGRRPLLMASAAGVGLTLFTVATAFIKLGINSTQGDTLVSVNLSHASPHTSRLGAAITIFAICAYVASFSIGLGPVAWVFVSEIFPLRLRAQAMGLAVFVNRLISGIVAITFLSISKTITPAGTFYLYGTIVFIAIVFFYFFIPETKGKTLEELSFFFDHGFGHKKRSVAADDQRRDEQNQGTRGDVNAC